jgi:glycosyltransferase involved in cell wall biosynthesis
MGSPTCGLLVDPLEPAAIAEAMGWLLEHPDAAEAMGKQGQELVRRRYSWETESAKLLQLYERLAREAAAA